MTRSLVLAGGGAKIGWASGALEVLLEESDLTFDHIDATSGSVFNLAMLLSGRSGHDISAAWGDRVASGHPAPGDRAIEVHLVTPEAPVPVDYLFFRNRRQMRPVIQAGREAARRYLDREAS